MSKPLQAPCIKEPLTTEDQYKCGLAYLSESYRKEKTFPTNEFRERIKGITMTLEEDVVVIGLEEFFKNYKNNLPKLKRPGNVEGLIAGILTVTKQETDSRVFDKIVKQHYEEHMGGEVNMGNLAAIVDAAEHDYRMKDEIDMRQYASDDEEF